MAEAIAGGARPDGLPELALPEVSATRANFVVRARRIRVAQGGEARVVVEQQREQRRAVV
jgi:hypothetical protein